MRIILKCALALLTVLALLSVAYASAAEVSTVSVASETDWDCDRADVSARSSQVLFDGWVEGVFGLSDGRRGVRAFRNRLTGRDAAIYDVLRPYLVEIAAGTRTDTEIFVAIGQMGLGQTLWSAADLGVDSVYTDGKIDTNAKAALRSLINDGISVITTALLGDLPYELYWFEKTAGVNRTWSYTAVRDASGAYYLTSSGVTWSFTVSEDFCLNGEDYQLDPEPAQRAVQAAANASALVDAYAELSDYDKLVAYRDTICEMTDYDTDSAALTDYYGSACQLVNVFDGDGDTRAVCEGYAKAFQYLCDKSAFDLDIVCSRASGELWQNGVKLGRHMWNLVTMPDGLTYLADITSCDHASLSEEAKPFLVGCLSTDDSGMIQIAYGSASTLGYVYDVDAVVLYTEAELTLSQTRFDPDAPLANWESWGPLQWRILDDGALTIIGSGDMPDAEYATDVPWHDRAEEIAAVRLVRGVTGVGAWAFADCTSLVQVILASTTSRVEISAFFHCPALRSVVAPVDNDAFSTADGVLYSAQGDCLVYCPPALQPDYELPSTISQIAAGAFAWGSGREVLTVPATVTDIAEGAFSDSSVLKLRVVPDSAGLRFAQVARMSYAVVIDFSELRSLALPGALTRLEKGAFQGTNAQVVALGDACLSIEADALANCASLLYVVLPDDLSSIAEGAFSSSAPVLLAREGTAAYACAVKTGLEVWPEWEDARATD